MTRSKDLRRTCGKFQSFCLGYQTKCIPNPHKMVITTLFLSPSAVPIQHIWSAVEQSVVVCVLCGYVQYLYSNPFTDSKFTTFTHAYTFHTYSISVRSGVPKEHTVQYYNTFLQSPESWDRTWRSICLLCSTPTRHKLTKAASGNKGSLALLYTVVIGIARTLKLWCFHTDRSIKTWI